MAAIRRVVDGNGARRQKPARRSGKRQLRFTVVMEFLVGLLGLYGVGRLLAGRFKEARLFLLASLVLFVPLDLAPRISGDEYALWIPFLIKGVLAALSAVHLNYMLNRSRSRA